MRVYISLHFPLYVFPGNALTQVKSYRFAILDMIPCIRILDDAPFLPITKERPNSLVPPRRDCNYSEIYESKPFVARILKEKKLHPPVFAPERKNQELIQIARDLSPPCRAADVRKIPAKFIPPWRHPPNPVPRGWKDYKGMAKACISYTKKEDAPPSPQRSIGQRRCNDKNTPAASLVEWTYSKSPMADNNFSYEYLHLIEPKRRKKEDKNNNRNNKKPVAYNFSDSISEISHSPERSVRKERISDDGSFALKSPPRREASQSLCPRVEAISSMDISSVGALPSENADTSYGVFSRGSGGQDSSTSSAESDLQDIVHMLRDLLIQKRKTVDLFTSTSRARHKLL